MKVLVADDEEDILESAKMLLESAGHDVEAVARADLELAAVRSFRPDVLLQDLNMPGLSIDVLLEEIRTEAPDLPIVLFTAAGNADDEQRRLRIQTLVRKPFELRDLLRALETARATAPRTQH